MQGNLVGAVHVASLPFGNVFADSLVGSSPWCDEPSPGSSGTALGVALLGAVLFVYVLARGPQLPTTADLQTDDETPTSDPAVL